MEPRQIDWQKVRKASTAAADAIADIAVSELTPSRRDFLQFAGAGRTEVGIIGTIRHRDPQRGVMTELGDVAALATALDGAEVAALAVTTETTHFGGSLEDLRLVSDAVSAPVVRDEPLISRAQIYQSRACGADAVVLPVAWLAEDAVADLVATASGLHMATLLLVFEARDLLRCLPHDKTAVALWGVRGDATLDRPLLEAVSVVPARRTVVFLGGVASAEELDTLQGLVDAAIVAAPFRDAAAVADAVDQLGKRA